MATLNPNYGKLAANYLFKDIGNRTKAFSEKTGYQPIKLGIGDTTEPLTPSAVRGMHAAVDRLAGEKTYSGYDPKEEGDLQEALSKVYSTRGISVSPSEIFISDGAKPDSANIQSIFGPDDVVAVQDPAYPVYVDTNVIAGRTGIFNKEKQQYEGLVYMACNEENGFFPKVPEGKVDLIYLCSPNNPTGAVATKEQLKGFVDYARENKAAIIFDAAYSAFIRDESLPRSIYEIKGAQECAIEINSFSKDNGFTGVRLGWTVVPEALVIEGTTPGEVHSTWSARQSRHFNKASNVVIPGGLEALTAQGRVESQEIVDFYMKNADIIKEGLQRKGLKVFGGDNAPYLWMQTPNGMSSWDFFDKLLNEAHVVGTPGVGFGPSGEGYFRLSAFGKRPNIEKAVKSIEDNLRL